MCMENINLQHKTPFTSFGQNIAIAEYYDKHILLTLLCKFWQEFELKSRYFALHLTEKF